MLGDQRPFDQGREGEKSGPGNYGSTGCVFIFLFFIVCLATAVPQNKRPERLDPVW